MCGINFSWFIFVIVLDTDLLQVEICVDANLIRIVKTALYAVINAFVQKVLNSICRFSITPLFLPFMSLKCVESFVLRAVVCKMGSFVKINRSFILGCNLVTVNDLLTLPMRNIDTVCVTYFGIRNMTPFVHSRLSFCALAIKKLNWCCSLSKRKCHSGL